MHYCAIWTRDVRSAFAVATRLEKIPKALLTKAVAAAKHFGDAVRGVPITNADCALHYSVRNNLFTTLNFGSWGFGVLGINGNIIKAIVIIMQTAIRKNFVMSYWGS